MVLGGRGALRKTLGEENYLKVEIGKNGEGGCLSIPVMGCLPNQ